MKSISLVCLSLLLSLFIGLSLAKNDKDTSASKQHDSSDFKPVIGFSLDTLKEARWQKDRDFFLEQAKKLGAEVKVSSANSDDTRQLQDVKALITSGIDALVIVPHNGEAMAKAVKLAHEENIPVLSYDRIITHCNLDLYITFNNVKVGETQAQYLIDSLPKDKISNIVRIYGAPTDQNAKFFKEGQDRVLNAAIQVGRIKVIHEDWAENWEPQNAKKIVNAAISKHGKNIQAVLASNDGTAGGAIQALKEEGLTGKILVTGQDADLVAVQRILGGSQHMTIYKPIKDIATKAAELAVKLAKREVVVAKDETDNLKTKIPTVLLDIQVVTKDNVLETVVKDGFHKAEDLGLN
jgi:D-xylose transport system substrate-binding protein